MSDISSKYGYLLALVCAIFLIVALFGFSIGPASIVLVSGFIALCMWLFTKPEERRFLLTIFICALAARFFASFIYYIASFKTGFSVDFYGDARGYSHNGLYISYVLLKKVFADMPYYDFSFNDSLRSTFFNLVDQFGGKLPQLIWFRVGGFAYLVGGIYTLFGYSPLTVKFINCLLIVSSGLLVYDIARRTFSVASAKLTFFITVFFPSIFIWSITGLKDPSVIFVFTLTIWAITWLQENTRFTIKLGIILLLFLCLKAIDLLQFGRTSSMFMIVIAICAFKAIRIKLSYKILFLLIATMAGVAVISTIKHASPIDMILSKFDIRKFVSGQVGFVSSGGNIYKIFPPRFYYYRGEVDITLVEFFFSYLKGVFYFLFSPFPWHMLRTLPMLAALPEMIFIYLTAPFTLLGIFLGMRYRLSRSLDILIYLAVAISAFSFVEGNIGTVFRHRALFLPVIFIFTSAGLVKLFTNRSVFDANGKQ